MKKLIAILIIFLISGCAVMSYQDKEGNSVTYARFLSTTDNIRGNVPNASVEVSGQNYSLDAIRVVTESAVKAAVAK